MSREMRDWPKTLRINAAAARLGSAVYYAKAEAFGGETLHWDALDVATRHHYTERAAELLRTLDPRPVSFATGLGKKVIGAVFPRQDGAA